MKALIAKILGIRRRYLIGGIIGAIVLGSIIANMLTDGGPERITETVTRGNVAHIVSISGVVEANNAAELAFPASGKVAEVLVNEGDHVTKGQTLAKLEQADLMSEWQDAYGALLIAQANRNELISGPSDEERAVTKTSVEIAEENLLRTIAEEAEKVENARRTLLSSGLEALPVRRETNDIPPDVSGTYTCDKEGVYTLSIFASAARSGFSYRLFGLEGGTYTGYTAAPAPLGTCGLMIQFNEDESYSSQDWKIDVPNTRGSTYTANLNAYELALQVEKNNVAAAEQALTLARQEETRDNASPRDEALARANAAVIQAEARLSAVNAKIDDAALFAPFDGTITDVGILPGETAPTTPVVTVLANDTFELSARVPEIDITKVTVGQSARIAFDARVGEELAAHVVFVSPLAVEIDGVGYFKALLTLDEPPAWLRSGLNADIDIIVEEHTDVLRIPKRFLIEDETPHVLIPAGKETVEKEVGVNFVGNDGFVEITGLNEGDTIVAP